MLIECSRCGAPLDVTAGQKIARCNYCNSSHRVGATQTIAAQTPSGWQPPQTWTPPEHVALPSRPLDYRKPKPTAHFAVAAGLIFVLVVGAVGWWALATSQPGSTSSASDVGGRKRVSPREVATVELAQTQVAFAKRFRDSKLDAETAELLLDESSFDSVTFTWNEKRDRILSVDLRAPHGAVDTAAIAKELGQKLGRHYLVEGDYAGSTYRAGASLKIGKSSGLFMFRSGPPDGERTDWKARGEALWTLMRITALDAPLKWDKDAQKVLRGHRLRAIAKLDPTVVVDKAEAHALSALPGTVASQSIDLYIDVLADHPWFGSVRFSWENKPNGRLTTMQLFNPTGRPDLADRDAIARCLEPVLGPAEVSVTDHLKKERLHQWSGTSHYVDGGNITANNVWLRIPEGARATAHFRSILTTLDACGRDE